MSAYHQIGHDSINLLAEVDLSAYRGAILSPVDYTEQEVLYQILEYGVEDFECVFDPQLYYPRSDRGHLTEWPYFPSDVDTADLSSRTWWRGLVDQLVACLIRIRPASVCSPAIVPRTFALSYYRRNCEVARILRDELARESIDVLQSVLIKMEYLAVPNAPEEIASVVTGSDLSRAYLVLVTDTVPRRELNQVEELKGALRLIQMLESSGMQVLVGFASSDLILWKAAGATDVATGKFFNLRRFTSARWDPPPEGGGQLPYWFEEAMMAFLRDSDLVRIRDGKLISQSSLSNPFGRKILEQMDADPSQAWLGLGWRQYLFWFADFEARIVAGQVEPKSILRQAENIWLELEKTEVYMAERQNNGEWLRAWRRVLAEAFR